ncbi:uncharacterized protein B0I36DRAFT_427431 [Microdochium trichocladiopsis]|uniref:BZIP domain-containing protein n=1 Tax=Microdochium trichocladiopsis TaxID=1682393 RepID=A0A9P9BWA0_9PEZI|nr:uncharacterized protein B0I36DRAFT_427431 [Microdochium trichocladiopsis]KAH7041158.1 hypothetical protein B0I36DRAFT_427431 [Microdochium trichocladiopsis]
MMDGISNANYEDRRKLQNRLAQRRYREKLKQQNAPAAYDAGASLDKTDTSELGDFFGGLDHAELFSDPSEMLGDHDFGNNLDDHRALFAFGIEQQVQNRYHDMPPTRQRSLPQSRQPGQSLPTPPAPQQEAQHQLHLMLASPHMALPGDISVPDKTRGHAALVSPARTRRISRSSSVADCSYWHPPEHRSAGSSSSSSSSTNIPSYKRRLHDKARGAFGDLAQLYTYSVDVGLLRSDPCFLPDMRHMQSRFVALMDEEDAERDDLGLHGRPHRDAGFDDPRD